MSSTKPRSADLHPGPGFRVRQNSPRLESVLVERFSDFDVPDISDTLNRLYALDSAIRCQNSKPFRLCGQVCTVRVFPGDNLMVHKALDVARPGDVVVVDGHGDRSERGPRRSRVHESPAPRHRRVHRGRAGSRHAGINELNFRVFARGTTAARSAASGAGRNQLSDLLRRRSGQSGRHDRGRRRRDRRHSAGQRLGRGARLEAHRARLASYLAAVQRGEFSNDWVDQVLAAAECPMEDG